MNIEFNVTYKYEVYFTENLFDTDNNLLLSIFNDQKFYKPIKLIFIIEEIISAKHQDLLHKISNYCNNHCDLLQTPFPMIILPGGENCKQDPEYLNDIYQKIAHQRLCRHSVVIAIGGGALLDVVGYAAATAHRGIPLIRIPTTVLAQCDSGVGVKNSINYHRQKNYLGTFAPPYAVINDGQFLLSLPDRDWRAGIAEAIKVSLIKDRQFFFDLIQYTHLILNRDLKALQKIIYRSAQLHVNHIAKSGDPFEQGSSRPLDFGHWAAHKLEILTHHDLRHGEAVAIGMALDVTYAYLAGFLSSNDWEIILSTLHAYQLPLFNKFLTQGLSTPKSPDSIFQGLDEFREHLGGKLTLMMLKSIGHGFNINHIDYSLYQKAILLLQQRETIDLEIAYATRFK